MSIPFVGNFLLKCFFGPLSALPYLALSVTDTMNGDKTGYFVHWIRATTKPVGLDCSSRY